MELLIPGLILVGLMVYASTRIKKSAAKAYEAETVETEVFTIDKPEGMLVVLGGDPKYLFDSYSREYGIDGFEDRRKLTARVTAANGQTVEQAIAALRSSEDVISDTSEVVGEYRYRIIEGSRSEDNGKIRTFHKLALRNGEVYRLDAEMIDENGEEMAGKVDSLVSSFHLK